MRVEKPSFKHRNLTAYQLHPSYLLPILSGSPVSPCFSPVGFTSFIILTVRVYHQSSSKRNQHYLNGKLNFQGDILACLGAKASKYIGNWKINLTKWASNLSKWGRYSDPNRRLHMESNKKRINGRK